VNGSNSTGLLGIPGVGRPFINGVTGLPATFLVAAPNAGAGVQGDTGTATSFSSSQLWTAEIGLVGNFYRGEFATWNGTLEFRHVNLAEKIDIITSTVQGLAGSPAHFFQSAVPVAAGTRIRTEDLFETTNHFYGANFGTSFEYRYHRIAIVVGNDVAIGSMRSSVNIIGTTTATSPAGAPLVGSPANGGLEAGQTNVGRRVNNNFSVVEQPSINLGYQLTRGIRISCGYDFLYTYNVLRPGLQIDPVINPNTTPTSATFGTPGGPTRPSQLFVLTDYYAQGVNWALTFRY
jgi:hypothetical protein